MVPTKVIALLITLEVTALYLRLIFVLGAVSASIAKLFVRDAQAIVALETETQLAAIENLALGAELLVRTVVAVEFPVAGSGLRNTLGRVVTAEAPTSLSVLAC